MPISIDIPGIVQQARENRIRNDLTGLGQPSQEPTVGSLIDPQTTPKASDYYQKVADVYKKHGKPDQALKFEEMQFNNDYKTATMANEVMTKPHLPDATKMTVYNKVLKPFYEKHVGMQMPELTEWPKGLGEDFAKRMKKINEDPLFNTGNKEQDRSAKLRATMGVMNELASNPDFQNLKDVISMNVSSIKDEYATPELKTYTADVGGQPMKMELTRENISKYPEWKKEDKTANRADALLNGRVIALKKSGKLNDISEDEIRAIAAQQLVNEEDTMLTRRAKEGRAVFGVMPGGAVGLALDRSPGPNQGKSFIVNENGAKQYLTSKEAESYMINQKMETPTSGIKEMKQAAPSVIYLAQEGRDAVNAAISSLGPASSRWREFASGKVGAGDPDFRELYNYSELMKSRLTKMHFGSKGGSEIVQRFDKMIDTSKDSPENMLRTFDNIEAYAKEVANEPVLFKENPQAVYDKVFKTYKSTGTKKKAIVKQFESKSTGKTKFVYSDGTEEIK